MAALDFPASPTNGQVFVGGNGVTYTWNGTLWLATGSSAGGDFFAKNTAPFVTNNTSTVVNPPVVTGNSGGHYSAAGRHTPPVGRYKYTGVFSGYYASAAQNFYLDLRKNGVIVEASGSTTAAANFTTVIVVDAILDMNGSDYAEFTVRSNSVASTGDLIAISAVPISGIQGPPGPSGPASTGDFCATLVGPASLATSAAVVIFPTIISGNSGGWLNTSTGAYTPPTGRYFLTAQFYGNLGGAATNLLVGITKNGGLVSSGYSTTASAAFSTLTTCAVTVDANGSDTFAVVAYGSPGTATGNNFLFTAYPISGIKGPPGDIGAVTGVIVDFAGSTAPAGWLLCQGQSVTVAAYPALHAAIGYQFGGSGLNFNVPDLGGRVTAGKEATATRLTTAGAGIDGATLGAAGGTQTHVLTVAQLASHSHDIYVIGATSGLSGGSNFNLSATTTSGAAGGNAAHQNTQPTMIINKIIKT